MTSKLQSDALREAISGIMASSKEKNCKIVKTIEHQIGLKNYDPRKDLYGFWLPLSISWSMELLPIMVILEDIWLGELKVVLYSQ
ncbi:60S ribosomal protein L10a, partial [Mucuna pruriens]